MRTTTHLSNVHGAHLVSGLNTLSQALARDERAQEATGERISGTVGVDDVLVSELGDGERLGVLVGRLKVGLVVRGGGRGDDGRLGTLGDDDETGSRSVLLGAGSDGLSDGSWIVGLCWRESNVGNKGAGEWNLVRIRLDNARL